MWTEIQLAYLAGIIDGEGTIYIQGRIKEGRNRFNYFPRFQVGNTDIKLINWLFDNFGGNRYTKDRSKHNPKWRTQYEWYTNPILLDQLLPLIIPFLVIKKEHAKIMFDFRQTFNLYPGRTGTPDSVQDYREECFHKLKLLNKRGIQIPSAVSPSALR
jgi:hypothetical protein